MILAFDIGNTNIVIGVIDNGKILFEARTYSDRRKTDDQYAIQIKNILEIYNADISKITGCIVASVVPSVLSAVKEAAFKITGIRPMIVGPGVKNGLNILMDNPAQLGSDLAVNAVAALNKYPLPLVIIDMGTATTISVVDKNRNYIGGCIIPGVKISLDALSDYAAQLPDISLETPKKVIGKNTVECMRSGVVNGNAAMIDGMINRIEKELGSSVTAIATGGISKFIVKHCEKDIIYDKSLLMEGLYIIYKKNR